MIIAPFEGDFAAALAAAARGAGWKTALASRAGLHEAGPVPKDVGSSDSAIRPWNPASYVSAGALALASASALGEADALVLVWDPATDDSSLFDGPPGRLGSSLEAAIEGPVYLAREMVRRFEARGAGRIVLISMESTSSGGEGDAPGSAAFPTLVSAAFRGLGEGLFARARGARWSAWGIADRGGKPEAAIDFALRLLDEPKTSKAGRWLPFGGKAGIFGVF